MSSLRLRQLYRQLRECEAGIESVRAEQSAAQHASRRLAARARAAEGVAAETLLARHAELKQSIRQRQLRLRRKIRCFPATSLTTVQTMP